MLCVMCFHTDHHSHSCQTPSPTTVTLTLTLTLINPDLNPNPDPNADPNPNPNRVVGEGGPHRLLDGVIGFGVRVAGGLATRGGGKHIYICRTYI